MLLRNGPLPTPGPALPGPSRSAACVSRPSSRSIASTCSLTLAAVGQAVAGGAGDWICVQGAGEVRGLDHDTGLGIDLQPVYAAIGVDLEGQKDILGMWFGDGGGESARFWMVVLTELRNRGVADVFFPGLRRLERPARHCQRGMACHDRANLSHSLDPQLLHVRLPEVLGSAEPRLGADLHRHQRRGRRRPR